MIFHVHVQVGELFDRSVGRGIDGRLYRSMKRSLCRKLREDGLKLLRRYNGEITQIL